MTCLFPIFLECKEWTLDPYWQEIFIQCSMGKFPRGLRMVKDGSLVVFSGKTREIVSLEGETLDIFKTMIKIFKEKLGLVSDRDIQKQKKEVLELKKKLKEGCGGTWKQIKPKQIRNVLLLNFVINCQKKYNLPQKITDQLASYIRLGFIFKTITSDDINYSDGIIHSINGLKFYNQNFKLNIFNKSEEKLEKSIESNKINQVFERYIKDYKAQTIKL